jgi:hypothetical protein
MYRMQVFEQIFAEEFIKKEAFYVSTITKTEAWLVPSLYAKKNCCIVSVIRIHSHLIPRESVLCLLKEFFSQS